MADLIGAFRGIEIFKQNEEKSIHIDSLVFRLFNKVTSSILVIASLAVTARQFFGEPISCDAGKVSTYY